MRFYNGQHTHYCGVDLHAATIFVRKRGQLLAHIQNTIHQYHLDPFGKRIAYPANLEGLLEHFPDPAVRESVRARSEARPRLEDSALRFGEAFRDAGE